MILHIISALEGGGAEALLDTLVRADSENEHAVVSLYTKGVFGESIEKAGVPVYALDMPRSKLTLRGIIMLYKLIRQYNPEAIHTWMYHANFLGGIVGKFARHKKIIWSIHNTSLDQAGKSRSALICSALCARMSSWLPTQIIHSSVSGAKLHISHGYNEKKMTVVPGGYNLNEYFPDKESRNLKRAELKIDDGVKLIGMLARWNAQKDHMNLVGALTYLKQTSKHDIKVALAGDGMDSSNTQFCSAVEEAGLAQMVILLGPRRDVKDLMNAMDVHVLSSAFGESFPNVVSESMSCGVPPVVTDVGDSAFIVGETGWVVPPKDPEAFASAIQAALDESETPAWQHRKEACRNRVKDNFSIEAMIKKYSSIWYHQSDI